MIKTTHVTVCTLYWTSSYSHRHPSVVTVDDAEYQVMLVSEERTVQSHRTLCVILQLKKKKEIKNKPFLFILMLKLFVFFKLKQLNVWSLK